MEEERSLTETPTWAFATVIALMVSTVFFFTKSFEFFAHWLDKRKRKRKPLISALNKIKEEFIVFGVLSLLLGHWCVFVAKICIKSSVFSVKYYPCIPETTLVTVQHDIVMLNNSRGANSKHQDPPEHYAAHRYCSMGYESFASYESLEQLHRLMFVLGTTHVIYSSVALVLAIIKIYSWRTWEDEGKAMASQATRDNSKRLNRLFTFAVHHASHPWSQHKVLVWLLCFSRQFWSSINKFDYLALRFGFLTTHQLPLSYDFLNYMIRSTDEEFRDIVGISFPLWIYAIFCIFLDFHGTDVYFCLSFLPSIIIIIIGTKLHRIVVKIALEVMDSQSYVETQEFNLRDELFWFGKPELLLGLIKFISFQNAFEMAMFLWSLWEINGTSCFMNRPHFIVIRLAFGVISQIWCSFITFPLYVIITEMGSSFKRTLISEGVRKSLHMWKKRVKARQSSESNSGSSNGRRLLKTVTSMPLIHNMVKYGSRSNENNSVTSTSSGRRSGRSRRRLSLTDCRDAEELYTSQRSSSVDEERAPEGYDSDTSSSGNNYEEDEDDYKKNDGHFFHL